MRCEKAIELLSDYCEGTLQTALSVPLESHLKACAECRAQAEGLREVYASFESLPEVEPPANLRLMVWERIDAAQRAHRETPRRAPFTWRALLTPRSLGWATAVVLLIVLTGVVIPGRYTAARMVFPWSLFYGAPQISREAPKTWGVTAGEPRIEIYEGRRILVVPLTTDAPQEISVEVGPDQASRPFLSGSPTARLQQGQQTEIQLELIQPVRGQIVHLEVSARTPAREKRVVSVTLP
jgi:hypothetical protein